MNDIQLQKQYTTNFDTPCTTCGGFEEDHDDDGQCLECGKCGAYLGQHDVIGHTASGTPIYSCPEERYYE